MTSSLVGSEMCIRDSLKEPDSGGGRKIGLCLCQTPTNHLLLVVAQHPVSYTHLTLPTICSV
eukprot:3809835-Prorocentrum_lima.AAC.1